MVICAQKDTNGGPRRGLFELFTFERVYLNKKLAVVASTDDHFRLFMETDNISWGITASRT